MLYRVKTASADGMHDVVAITPVCPDGEDRPGALGEIELAMIRSAVRGQLDLAGRESGLAITVVDFDGEEVRALPEV